MNEKNTNKSPKGNKQGNTQKKTETSNERPSIVKQNFNPGTMLNPVPVVMVSCQEGDKSNIITVAWTGIVNSDPPTAYISVRRERFSHDIIENTGEFVINLATKELTFATDYCGVKSGADVDKFKELNLTAEPSEKVSCPRILESPVNLECKIINKIEMNTHDMFLAEIVNVSVDESLIEDNGNIALDKAGLIAYVHGEYIPLKREAIGGFGYSVMKKKTIKRRRKEGKKTYNRKSK